jgi:vancomycin aglycone glucosyltransferase
LGSDANQALWSEEEQSWNGLFRDALNEERAKLGLDPVESVQRHIFTDRPWLAADAALAPAGAHPELKITQPGAWLLDDPRPLPDHIEDFLARGEPPVYFGFGSMRVLEGSSRALIEAARAVGRRSIISQGWGNLQPIDNGGDCISVDDVSHGKLFPRVAAIVHHGGAGTTTAAARSGKPQVIVPHHYDQFYWAHRIKELGIGTAGPRRDELTLDGMTRALAEATQPHVEMRAAECAPRIEIRGAQIAANHFIQDYA